MMKTHTMQFVQSCKDNPEFLIIEARSLTKTLARRIGKRKLRAAESVFDSCPPEFNEAAWKSNCAYLRSLADKI